MAYTDSIFKARVGRSVDRDALEHNRINDRIGPQSRFQTAANLIFQPDHGSDMYVNEKQRFNKNFDTYDRAKREQQRLKQENFYDLRKQKRLDNDEKRWSNINKRDQYNEQKRLYHQQVLLNNKRNNNGQTMYQNRMPYNPISLDYQKSKMGDQLKRQDQDKQVRRFVRAQNLMNKNNASYNILTGQQKASIKKYVPQPLKERVGQIIKMKAQTKIKYKPKRDKYDYLDD